MSKNAPIISFRITADKLVVVKPDKERQAFLNAHYNEIKKKYGKKRADTANIGWVSNDDSICSKVYGNPCMCVTTYKEKHNGKYIHEHTKY